MCLNNNKNNNNEYLQTLNPLYNIIIRQYASIEQNQKM